MAKQYNPGTGTPLTGVMQPASYLLPKILLAVSLAVLGLMGGALAWRAYEMREAGTPANLVVLPEPRVIADFALQDHRGQPFSLAGFRGQWSVLFFGFTSCPDICPNTLYVLQQARSRLLERFAADAVPDIYLVSVDPERDSPEKLASYLAHFDSSFTGLTGEDVQLRALTMQLGVMYHIEPHDAGDSDYAVDHSASLILLDPEGRLHGVLPAPHDVDRITAGLTELAKRARRS